MTRELDNLAALMPKEGLEVFNAEGSHFIKQIGIETVKQVIHAVLCGENLRNSTEKLTRKRISILNGSTIIMFLKGCQNTDDFIETSIKSASERLKNGILNKNDKWILNWLLGLTEKAVQNILRDDPEKFINYITEFDNTLTNVAHDFQKIYGELECKLSLPGFDTQTLGWKNIIHILSVVGAQTLTIRGSEKSTYGKLFERLILGSLLHILGFKLVDHNQKEKSFDKVFWLSQRSEKRESDATLIYKAGKGIRFDIGFIGRGNTEISLDKVSRFDKELKYGRSTHFMATFIIVDKIGEGSRIYEMAKKIDGTIIQMSMSYWIKLIAEELNKVLKYKHEILNIPNEKLHSYLNEKMKNVPVESFLK
ncbi:MAG: CfrBI family restriction endonuclease [Nitrospirae bacterium]|uniref:CfrBI family restriction endonuclease n=1 Tax=Candidatus Magnetobacterium casense TaxID=1455061 RepID=UPI00059150E3|nr:CfrBI family restriction endonuclease [Candidatus Magnetobacterium casensis]MBF0338589.1 CfrBI family restriction endonuclease [Nitrospirota bacterium]